MGYWDESDIPFYYSLANTFCIGNRYFCSVPAQTYPNRRFLYAGTASGMTSTSDSTFRLPRHRHGSVMDNLRQHGVSFMSYFTDLPDLAIIPTNLERHPTQLHLDRRVLRRLRRRHPAQRRRGSTRKWASRRTSAGRWPASSPKLPQPLASIRDPQLSSRSRRRAATRRTRPTWPIGEAAVARIINAVMQSPAWQRTLLVWNYDEHGGYYDHVLPPTAIIPDAIRPTLSPTDVQGAYNLYGIRVPNAVVSPYSRPHARDQCGARPHVGHRHHQQQMEPARTHLAGRQREST